MSETKNGDSELQAINLELAKLELEHKKLMVEDLRVRVTAEKNRREQAIELAHKQQISIDEANKIIIAEQKFCKHKKGGKNLAGVLNGNDGDYSVAKHIYPWGEIGVLCTRCGKEWRRPPETLRKLDKKLYQQRFAQWQAAVEYPTDNETSGSQCFVIMHGGKPFNTNAQI